MLPQARADREERFSLYIHGIVWSRRLPSPMNDWLVRLDALSSIPIGDLPGFAALADPFHDSASSQVRIQSAVLNGSQLTLTGFIAESKGAGLTGQPVRIEGRLNGTSVDALTLAIGPALFIGMGTVAKFPSGGGPVAVPFPN